MILRAMLAALSATFLLAACQSVPPEQRAQACATTDWERYGRNDGRLGVATAERAEEFEDCTELGHTPDLPAYQEGRAEGLAVFCTVENGYEVGYRGRRYAGTCPPELEPDFLQGYKRGRKERPVTVSPRIGIGIGSGGRIRTGVGIGLFAGHWGDRWDRWNW